MTKPSILTRPDLRSRNRTDEMQKYRLEVRTVVDTESPQGITALAVRLAGVAFAMLEQLYDNEEGDRRDLLLRVLAREASGAYLGHIQGTHSKAEYTERVSEELIFTELLKVFIDKENRKINTD